MTPLVKYSLIGGGVISALALWWLYEQNAAAASTALVTTTGTGTDTTDDGSGDVSDNAQAGSDYGAEDYSNPYGLDPECPQQGTIATMPAIPLNRGKRVMLRRPTPPRHRRLLLPQQMHGLGRHRHRNQGGGGSSSDGSSSGLWFQAGQPDSAWGEDGSGGYYQSVFLDDDIS